MTTAHKPTYHPAVGSANPGGYRFHAPKVAYSARDVASHTKLKVRQVGQSAPEEVETRDLKRELDTKEAMHYEKTQQDKRRAGLLPYPTDEEAVTTSSSTTSSSKQVDLSQFDDADDEQVPSDDEKPKANSDDESDDSDEEDEEAVLLRELEAIKKEREEKKKQEERERAEKEAKEKTDAVLHGNPLLNADFKVKRRWDDDVVFKNQAADEPQKLQKRFINDTIRSDFHRSFLKKYVQ